MRYLKGTILKTRQPKTKKRQEHQPGPVLPGSPVHRLLQLLAKSIVKKYEPNGTERDRTKN
tara:strand:- start:700 stop:882 length:183 start_codon:yes stop_codon:yes gene_type:complete